MNEENPFDTEYNIIHKLKNGIVDSEVRAWASEQLLDIHKNITSLILDYLDINEKDAKIISLWIIGTYFHDQFMTYPLLFFNAMRGSGKTRMLKLIASLAKGGSGFVINNITDAVLFRHPKNTILCIDEIENIGSKERSTLRELLNSAYKKGMRVQRMKKVRVQGQEQQVVDTFEPYFPIAMCNIWGVEEVLADRSLVIILEKSNRPEVTKKIEMFADDPIFLDIKRRLNELCVVCVVSLREKNIYKAWNNFINSKYSNSITTYIYITTYNNTKQQQDVEERSDDEKREDLMLKTEFDEFFNKIDEMDISGRNLELIFPIILISRQLGPEIMEDTLQILKNTIKGKQEEEFTESRDVSMIEFCALHGRSEYVSLKDITSHFKLFVGDSVGEENWVNEKWVGRALKRLNLIKAKRREASGRFVVIDTEKAQEKLKIFKR